MYLRFSAYHCRFITQEKITNIVQGDTVYQNIVSRWAEAEHVIYFAEFQETLDNVLANDYSLTEPEFEEISDAAKAFIIELLVTDPRGR